ncbi:MAG: type II toxin-antitoxin system Phd/YefM family antitoxin [Prochlorococcaceae cyanobacterium]
MNRPVWTLQDAKNRFSAVVEAALAGTPQMVTRRGRLVSVVISADAFERLSRLEQAMAPSLPALLMEIPQDDEAFARLEINARDLECS